MPGASELGADSLYQLHVETDDLGRVLLSDVPLGSYVVEARNDSLKGFAKISYASEEQDSLTVDVSKPSRVSGRVGLPQMVRSAATVSVQGLDYHVQMDSTGYFEFESLPNGNVEIVAFVNEAGVDSVTEYGRIEADVGSDSSEGALYLGDSAYVKTYFVFEDFENGKDGWAPSASYNASVDFDIAPADLDREGNAAHFVCVRDSAADWDWALIGRDLGGYVDMSNLDSIKFWARASEASQISFAFDVFVNSDSVTSSENKKAWKHFEVDTVWTQFVVIPAELDTSNNGGNVGWDSIKDSVTKISIFGQMGTEIWVDNIEVFGYGIFDPYAPLSRKND